MYYYILTFITLTLNIFKSKIRGCRIVAPGVNLSSTPPTSPPQMSFQFPHKVSSFCLLCLPSSQWCVRILFYFQFCLVGSTYSFIPHFLFFISLILACLLSFLPSSFSSSYLPVSSARSCYVRLATDSGSLHLRVSKCQHYGVCHLSSCP